MPAPTQSWQLQNGSTNAELSGKAGAVQSFLDEGEHRMFPTPPDPASTLVAVQGLAEPHSLLEIADIAVPAGPSGAATDGTRGWTVAGGAYTGGGAPVGENFELRTLRPQGTGQKVQAGRGPERPKQRSRRSRTGEPLSLKRVSRRG